MNYLFPAFFVIWLFLFIYVFFIQRKQEHLFNEIEKLKTELKEKQAG